MKEPQYKDFSLVKMPDRYDYKVLDNFPAIISTFFDKTLLFHFESDLLFFIRKVKIVITNILKTISHKLPWGNWKIP